MCHLRLERLRELRIQKELTQEDLAKYIGVSRTTYAMYEQGNRQMDYESLLKLADYFQVSLDYLFGRTDFPINFDSYSEDEKEFILKALNLYKEIKEKYVY